MKNKMNREIKFRAWDKNIKVMRDWDYTAMGSTESVGHFFSRRDYELMRFTGLKDKNGKEIYEGDIVRQLVGTKEKVVGNIIWSGWQYTLVREVKGKDNTDYFGYNSEDIDPDRLEVIGNIYENPELLKGQKTKE